MTSAHSTRNTSIRTRKIRGEDNLVSSISISEREEGPEGIAGVIRYEKPRSGTNMAQRAGEKSRKPRFQADQRGTCQLKPGFDFSVFCETFDVQTRDFA